MQTKPKPSAAEAELRRCAEERLREQHPEMDPARTETDMHRLVHELQVHQIELEMQNEELLQARDKIEMELERFSDLYDFAPVGYLTLDPEGTIREANLTCAGLLGIERSRLVKRRFGLCVSATHQPVFNAFIRKVFESKAREFCEVTLLKEGKDTVEVRIEAAVAASGRECRAVLEDITKHKRAEADRLILNKLESTGILAGGLAHDFNNLLTIILLNLELAETLIPPGEELARHLKEAKKAVLTSRGLTQQLIAFAKGGQPIRRLTSVSEVIQEFARAALGGSRVRCEFSMGEELWLAEMDPGQFGQVIRNMVLNAREALRDNGVISIRAENAVLGAHENLSLPPGDYVRVNIADQGGGIAAELLSKIFDPYFSTKQRGDQKGMGLGLTICHAIMQKHGGAIVVDSKLGVGTTFSLLLPASRKSLAKEKSSGSASHPRSSRILVMEDEVGLRNLVGISLRRMDQEVELVENGQRAIEAYLAAKDHGRPFDLVILDLTVRGGVGGHEAIRALLQIDPAVKAVVMSGYVDDPLVLEPERYGFKGGLAKPFDTGKLREVLCRVLGPGESRVQ